ncbi:N-terminal phage integrase SAM-like domain-containing protein [Paenibacillus glucanolyticus]|uniref:N-terminal phage integrase SAM-like domain-containing protein n=1 Tax=Paenibacillus glucanolyticus TaxID=59843 RepID=UPI0021169F6E|nr:N-terminal phage integrase SAM-like domain-containing protein [Paenibacillus glucanolyticus]
MHVDDSKITLREYLLEYLETPAKPNFKPTSYDTEKTVIEARIIPALGKVKLQALTPRAIKTFYAELRKTYSKEYVKTIHGILKRALRNRIHRVRALVRGYHEQGIHEK